jgi:serine/tyrosine/threonine adenylyltransferase
MPASSAAPPVPSPLGIAFDNSYARELPSAGARWQPARAAAPQLLFANLPLAEELGLPQQLMTGPDAAALWAGNVLPEGAEPFAQAYAGHQFGRFSPQLGDGRALLLGEVLDRQGRRRDIAFKGSGRTPYSRGGDGKAAMGPMLREALVSEAMHALGVPTTRALAVVATGEPVWRELELPGAVLTRVAASHLRIGSFQFFAARGELDMVQRLLDYAIARHDPELAGTPDAWLGLLRAVAQRQARLVAQWMNIGFIHGVMNTDNITISGETIDYGPCAFLEAYDPATVFSSIDHGGRYAFGNQPAILRWNLARLAEALLPLAVPDAEDEAAVQREVGRASELIDAFPGWVEAALLEGRRAKLGLVAMQEDNDAALAEAFLELLQRHRADHTLAWRALAPAALGDDAPLRAWLPPDAATEAWLARWRARLGRDGTMPPDERAALLRRANPWLVPRNHRVEEALAAASGDGDLAPFQRLLAALQQPFDEDPAVADLAESAPAAVTACYKTFCGT